MTGCKGFKGFKGFKAFKGWQTAGLDAHKKTLMCGVALGCLLAAGCSMANGRLGPPGRGKGQAWTPIRRKKTLMCRLAVPVGCRMKHAKGMFKRWLLRAGKWPWKAKKEKFHTCGGPRRRPCLGQGRGRRIYIYICKGIDVDTCTISKLMGVGFFRMIITLLVGKPINRLMIRWYYGLFFHSNGWTGVP